MSMAFILRTIRLVVPALLLAVASAGAQQKSTRPAAPPPPRPVRAPLGMIDGTVTDTNLVPIPMADVTVLRTTARVATDNRGRFKLLGVPAGQYLIIVRRLGYRPLSGIIDVPQGDTIRLAYQLDRVAQTLGAVTITEQRHSLRLMDFELRAKAGVGEFLTQADIDKRASIQLSDILKFSKTMSITNDNTSGHLVALSRREGGSLVGAGAGYCPMQIMLDGVPLPSGFPMELLPSPRDVAGVEIYSGPATVPMQFGGQDKRCGMVLVWTKDGY